MAEPDSPQDDLRREVGELKRLIGKQQERMNELAQQPAVLPETVEALGLDTPTGRRQAMKYAGGAAALPTLLALAASQPGRADAVNADWGTEADPWNKFWTHAIESGDGADFLTLGDAIQQANEAVSSATTIGNVCYIEVDTTISSFTVTIPASLEASGIELRFVDEGGNAGSNSFDVTSTNWNIDGSGTATVDVSDTAFVLYSAGDRWVSHRFIQKLDAGEIATEGLDIAEVSKGSTSLWLTALAAGNSGQLLGSQATDDVSTSAKTIFDLSDTFRAGKLIVLGREQADGPIFFDLVAVDTGNTQNAYQSFSVSGTSENRTYSRIGTEIQLAMDAETYDVAVSANVAGSAF